MSDPVLNQEAIKLAEKINKLKDVASLPNPPLHSLMQLRELVEKALSLGGDIPPALMAALQGTDTLLVDTRNFPSNPSNPMLGDHGVNKALANIAQGAARRAQENKELDDSLKFVIDLFGNTPKAKEDAQTISHAQAINQDAELEKEQRDLALAKHREELQQANVKRKPHVEKQIRKLEARQRFDDHIQKTAEHPLHHSQAHDILKALHATHSPDEIRELHRRHEERAQKLEALRDKRGVNWEKNLSEQAQKQNVALDHPKLKSTFKALRAAEMTMFISSLATNLIKTSKLWKEIEFAVPGALLHPDHTPSVSDKQLGRNSGKKESGWHK